MKTTSIVTFVSSLLVLSAAAGSAYALKFAPVEHHLQVDPAIPSWQPGEVQSVPEEELALVGADVMDEITLGWAKLFRQAYPRLSVTIEAKASGTGGPALTEGRAHLAPVGRELLPAEEKGFVDKFGYKPLACCHGKRRIAREDRHIGRPRRQGQSDRGTDPRSGRRDLF
jgi:phosphate transport system substrate-binding protein